MKSTVIYEQSSVLILARVHKVGTNSYLTVATTSLLSVKTYNASTLELVTAVTPPVSASIIFDTLQTDQRWREDETGYNLAIPLDQSHFPDGNTNYTVEVAITPADGYVLRFAVNVHTENLLSV